MASTGTPTTRSPSIRFTMMPSRSPTIYNATFRPAPPPQAVMSIWIATAISVIISFGVTVYLLNFYARKDTPIYAKIFTGLSWICGFVGILTLLPLGKVKIKKKMKK